MGDDGWWATGMLVKLGEECSKTRMRNNDSKRGLRDVMGPWGAGDFCQSDWDRGRTEIGMACMAGTGMEVCLV